VGHAKRLAWIGAFARTASPHLLLWLDHPESEIRSAMRDALTAIGSPLPAQSHSRADLAAIVAAFLSDDDPDARSEAAACLEQLGADALGACPALRAALSDPVMEVRVRAAATLWSLAADPAVLPVLLDALEELILADSEDASPPRHYTLERAARTRLVNMATGGLARMGTSAAPAVPALSRAFASDWLRCRGTKDAFASIGEPALPALREFARSSDDYVRRDAEEVLAALRTAGSGDGVSNSFG
jgi:HEAT repeat protein